MMKNFDQSILDNVNNVSSLRDLPKQHKEYLLKIKNKYNLNPKVIYDIGSCVLHWTSEAQEIWNNSEIILFDATDIFEPLYINKGYRYNIGVISNESNKTVKFYQNNEMFAGNSYYKENPTYSLAANWLYDESKIVELPTKTLDQIVVEKSFPFPELIKIDVQGSELDVLKGAEKCLDSCMHLIVELREVEYNIGSPEKEQIIKFLESRGFKNLGMFCNNGLDGDYHFIKYNTPVTQRIE